jgi:RNA 3'-terminal phosphate cyclase-like protein
MLTPLFPCASLYRAVWLQLQTQLTAYSVQYLRHLRDFFGTVFKIKPDLETSSVMLSCLGVGYKNVSRSAT